MPIRVLIVDDSLFFRRALREVFAGDERLEVIGEASNGRQAVLKACELKPDIITMDVEMPIMDGISAVRRIAERCPTPILMLSALTKAGAEATLDALDAGAVDFFPKNGDDPEDTLARSGRRLCSRVRMLALRAQRENGGTLASARPEPAARPSGSARSGQGAPSGFLSRQGLVVIGASTGGPAAVPAVLGKLPTDFPVPIVIAQHMPGAFTGPFAQRLNDSMPIRVVEAGDGDLLRPGTAYVIPGGKHGEVGGRHGSYKLNLRDPVADEHYRPSVSLAFSSAARVAADDLLTVVLTGMGDDGAEGARQVVAARGHVWAQDQASSVIYGMPAAVAKANLAESVLPLGQIGAAIGGALR
ncbi:chemotaxis response regulator protein-glutamate methylesterase [Guyparkeria hydrothermalis]|uniref:protein-glutamate methylesterase/protein-glutamine glutaminase n=1 Tax=Guyparkeria hydrothermalis TaxID=923 RepID=UPI002020C16A|nr:chemotaxis response regulator protein-glutamate methylesterase [Guyparkeria hydrothermalis]MCL7745423.1 chemotaxis response regulator protein-glutamate methylesterase [Guyparkeria hydrothermalis]